jgi:deoxyribodipyrimidine photolyase
LFLIFIQQIKADWSVCAGNWNWISTGNPEKLLDNNNSTFCPVKYGKKIDPQGLYIKQDSFLLLKM